MFGESYQSIRVTIAAAQRRCQDQPEKRYYWHSVGESGAAPTVSIVAKEKLGRKLRFVTSNFLLPYFKNLPCCPPDAPVRHPASFVLA